MHCFEEKIANFNSSCMEGQTLSSVGLPSSTGAPTEAGTYARTLNLAPGPRPHW